jgi:hypothetical protein
VGPSIVATLLVGLYHCGVCKENDSAFQIGVASFVDSQWGLRLRAQLDVRHIFPALVGFDGLRFASGIVLPMNNK